MVAVAERSLECAAKPEEELEELGELDLSLMTLSERFFLGSADSLFGVPVRVPEDAVYMRGYESRVKNKTHGTGVNTRLQGRLKWGVHFQCAGEEQG